jgi:DNA-binding transcriptional MocR family regulator
VSLETLSPDQIRALHDEQSAAYEQLKAAGLALDITRGKPSAAQLDLSNDLLDLPGQDYEDASGTDTRNYGGVVGNLQLREIFAELLHVPADQVVAGDNASLAIMHDLVVFSLLKGTVGSQRPWAQEEEVVFLCPSPGYDRHFAICQQYGITMRTIDMLDDGPDMAAVREAVADPAVKGIWLVPTYANPTGAVVSEAVAAELAALETAAPDFRIFWDNAYAVHHLTEERTKTADIVGLCAASGHPDRPFVLASTSKITFAGAGVSFFASSPDNIAWYTGLVGKRTIGPDKVNQLRHVRLLQDVDGVHALMDRHREILAPKFAVVQEVLSERLGPHDVATWTQPRGGYFVSLDVPDGCATRVVQLAKEAGIALTPAGASFPYGKDPRDRNIRIAPSFPPIEELRTAMEGLATCVLLAAAEQRLG